MTDAAPLIQKLTKRSEFLACAQAPSCAKGSVVVQARPRGDDAPLVRVGFTATKRIGGAVERNRAKRRMREAARVLLPEFASPGVDYVIIARGGVLKRPWARLLDDVKSALLRLAAERTGPQTLDGPAPSSSAPSSPAGNLRPRS
jgi:ribonuclease P protein component